MTDYKQHFEDALEARDAAGWLGTSPAETITNLSIELRETRDALHLFRQFVIWNATQWKIGAGTTHPIWPMIAEMLRSKRDIRDGALWRFIQSDNHKSLADLREEFPDVE